jgi:hypothetical protein
MFAKRLTGLALLVAALGWAPAAFGRDDPKPDDLEKVLDTIEGKKADDKDESKADKKSDDKKADDKKAEARKDEAKKDDKPKAGDEKAEAKKGEPKKEEGKVESKDEDIDDILKGLGGGKDAPETEGPAAPQPEGSKPKVDPAQPKPEDKPIDEELERLQGKIKKKPPQQQQGGGGGQRQGPLDEVIKKMRDVEKRLGQPDTGEKTREEQQQIVSELDKYLERLRQMRSTSQSRSRQTAQGNSPGQNNGNPGNNPGQGDNRTIRPKQPPKQKPRGPVIADKNIWGQLPETLREEMNNIFKEEPLPEKFELVRRYYDAVAKKALKKEQ